MYRNVGSAVVISILDIFEKNPYSRIPNTIYKSIGSLRKEMGWETSRVDRFRREPHSLTKAKKFNEWIYEKYTNDFTNKKVFFLDQKFFECNWP